MTDLARIGFVADTSQLKDAKGVLSELERQGKQTEKSTKDLDSQFKTSNGTAQLLANTLKTLAAAFSIREVIAYADEWQNAENRLRTVTDSAEQLASTQKDLISVANQTRSAYSATAELYTTLSRSTGDLNLSQKELLDLTATINQTFAIAGASAGAAEGAIRQLSQALASGALRGDEFNSVAEQAPGIMDAVAKSLNMTRGELREYAAEGKITSEVVVNAMQEAAQSINQEFSKTVATFGQSATIARNNLLEFVGSSEEVKTATAAIGNALVALSENLDIVGKAIPYVAAALVARLIPAIAATVVQMAAATTGAKLLSGAFALIGGPAGTAFLVVAGLAAIISSMETTAERTERLREQMSELNKEETKITIERLQRERDSAQATLDRLERTSKGYAAESAAIQAQAKRIDEINALIDEYSAHLDTAATASEQAAKKAQDLTEAFRGMGAAQREAANIAIEDAISKQFVAIMQQEAKIRESVQQLKRLAEANDPQNLSDQVRARLEQEKAALRQLEVELSRLTQTRAGYRRVLEEGTDATDESTAANRRNKSSVEEVDEALVKARKKIDDMILAQKTELSQLKMTDLQRNISNALIAAGTERTGEQTAAIIANEIALYEQKKAIEANEEAAAKAAKRIADAAHEVATAQEKAAERAAEAAAEAARKSAEEWRLFRSSMSDFFADLMMEGGNAWDNLAKSAERAIYKMVADLAASGLLSLLTGKSFNVGEVLGNSGVAGSIVGAVLGGIGGLFGEKKPSTQVTEAAYAEMMKRGVGEVGGGLLSGIGSILGGGGGLLSGIGKAVGGLFGGGGAAGSSILGSLGSIASSAGTAASSLLSAIPGWGVALAGVGALASKLDKSTPSYNAGILLKDLQSVGADRKFEVEKFDSGLTPVGFNRRTSVSEANEVVEAFRQYDSAVTMLKEKAGASVTAAQLEAALSKVALDEQGKGSGIFMGVAGESGGSKGKALDLQLNDYVRAYFSTFIDQLDEEVGRYIMAGRDADEMIARAAEKLAVPDAPTPSRDDEERRYAERMEDRAMHKQAQERNAKLLEDIAGLLQSLVEVTRNANNDSAEALADAVAELGSFVQGLQRSYSPEVM